MKLRPLLTGLLLVLATGLSVAETPTNYSITPVPREGGWMKQHEHFNEISKKGEAQIVFLGDSITAGWSGRGKEVWKKNWEPLKAANFGIGGDRTEHVLWRLDHGNFDGLKPKLIILMIGTNNTGHEGRPQKELNGAKYHSTPQQTAEGVKAILDKLKAKCPESKVLLLAIFPRGADENNPARKTNTEVNNIIKGYADDKTVYYMDIGPKFLAADGTLSKDIMPDLLHPNDKGYEIWTDAIRDKVMELTK